MRHHSKKRKLHREKGQRVALLRGLSRSLVLRGQVVTTVAKAKELRPYIERLITVSRNASSASRRAALREIGSDAVKKLHDDIAKRYHTRPGGYTRIVRIGRVGKRVGEQARIEFV